MSGSLSRRSALQLTGVVSLTGIFGALGAQPAHAMTDPAPPATMLQKMQYWSDVIDDANVGYDQKQRYTFLDEDKHQIISNKECDCSSSCAAIAWLAGYKVSLATYTGNFAANFKDAGFKLIKYDPDLIKTGDFILTVANHHVVFVRDSKHWWSAEADEHGNASGGSAGDQTGSECRYRAPYKTKLSDHHWETIIRRP